jgi:hypothetical protein
MPKMLRRVNENLCPQRLLSKIKGSGSFEYPSIWIVRSNAALFSTTNLIRSHIRAQFILIKPPRERKN